MITKAIISAAAAVLAAPAMLFFGAGIDHAAPGVAAWANSAPGGVGVRVVHSDVNLAASVSAGTAPRAGSMAEPGPEPWPEPEPSKPAPKTKTAPAPKASPRGPIPVCPDCGRYPPVPPKVN
jgi:hypothetical protein